MSTTNTEDSMRWGPPHDTLREQLEALPEGLRKGDVRLSDVLVVFAERERVLRERIEARLEAEASWVDPVLRADLLAVLGEEAGGTVEPEVQAVQDADHPRQDRG